MKRGFGDVFVASLRPILEKRQDGGIITKVNDAKTAFSSWDNCMQATFCKYGHPFPTHLSVCPRVHD